MTAFEPFEDFGDIDEIVERLNDADGGVRRLAVIDLAETARQEVLPHLLAATDDPDVTVRLQVALAFAEFDASEAARAQFAQSGNVQKHSSHLCAFKDFGYVGTEI